VLVSSNEANNNYHSFISVYAYPPNCKVGHAPSPPSYPIHDMEVTANTKSDGNHLEADSLLGGGGASGAGRGFSSRLKRVVDEIYVGRYAPQWRLMSLLKLCGY
jgi:hypothetical protein